MRKILAVVAWAVFVIAAASGAADAQVEPRFMLTGVVVVEGGGRAWLQEPQFTQNQPVAIRPGETIGPYRLTKIFEDRVELVGPAGTISVLLAGVSGPAGVAATPLPRPAPPRPSEPTTHEVIVLPPGPPLAELPPGTPRVDFESLLRGVLPSR